MSKIKAVEQFFDDISFVSIVDTIRGIYMSDGATASLMDFERVIDTADTYAFKNWILGELVQGPTINKYSASCVFMWPHKLMPDPRGAMRLVNIGCSVVYGKGNIDVPVQISSPDDFFAGTKYPKMSSKKVWFVKITIPFELMDDIKEGTIDLADQTIDLSEIEDAYDDDLDEVDANHEETDENSETDQNQLGMQGDMGMNEL